jgi:hypothetical protein
MLGMRRRLGVEGALAPRSPRSQGRQRQGVHLAERRLVVRRDEAAQLQHVRGQCREVGDRVDGAHAFGRDLARRIERDDHAVHPARAEAHVNHAAGGQRQAFGRPIIERLRCGDRQRNARNGHCDFMCRRASLL